MTQSSLLSDLEKAAEFINSIDGIRCEQTDDSIFNEFCPGTLIRDNCLYYNPNLIECAGDLLHEAGHFAITSAEWRPLIRDSRFDTLLEENFPQISEHLDRGETLFDLVENPVWRMIIDADENAVIAWSYAAAISSGIYPSTMHTEGFGDDWLSVSESLEGSCGNRFGLHPGINRLRHIGMLATGEYPSLIRWAQM